MKKYTKGILSMVQQEMRTVADVAEMRRVHEEVVARSGVEEGDPHYYPSLCEALVILQEGQQA